MDGAYVGSSFPHLLLMAYPELVPLRPLQVGLNVFYPRVLGPRQSVSSFLPYCALAVHPSSILGGSIQDFSLLTRIIEFAGCGVGVGIYPQHYVPRVYGFRLRQQPATPSLTESSSPGGSLGSAKARRNRSSNQLAPAAQAGQSSTASTQPGARGGRRSGGGDVDCGA